ncbi:hypothetical protein C0992_006476 [Termitomyces sp. T32_za158]|nr:hypothetical protein C0992_006476 [Termitomyces sp. T32_za158]
MLPRRHSVGRDDSSLLLQSITATVRTQSHPRTILIYVIRYTDPERQRLLAGPSNHAIYSDQVPPEGPQANKRPSRHSEPDQEPHSDDPRSSNRYSERSRLRLPADDFLRIRRPVWIILLLALAGLIGFYSGQPSEAVRNGIRERWEIERRTHTIEVDKWNKDRNARRTQETEEIERFKKEEKDLIDRKEKMIADYNRTEQAWRQKVARFEEEWQRKVDEENRKRDRARLYWDDIKGDEHCLSNGRKKYTARLANLPSSLDAMEACKFTPITLNGVTYDNPIICENTVRLTTDREALGAKSNIDTLQGPHGVRGHWVADNEGVCAAYWEYVKTKVVVLFVPLLLLLTSLRLQDCTAPGSGYRVSQPIITYLHLSVMIMINLISRSDLKQN